MKTKNKLIILGLSIIIITIICFYYNGKRLKETSNIIVPKIKYTCTSTAIDNDATIYYNKVVIEGTNAGRIVNYYTGMQTLFKSDEAYKNMLNNLMENDEISYQDIGTNSIYTYIKTSTDETGNIIISKTIKDLNNINMKCIKEKINS